MKLKLNSLSLALRAISNLFMTHHSMYADQLFYHLIPSATMVLFFDSTMSMSSHIPSISRSLNYHLRNVGRIRCYIDEDTCNHALRPLVISRIDYCNSLLYGLSAKDMQKLQNVQNRAARLVYKSKWQREYHPSTERATLVSSTWANQIQTTNTCIQKQTWNNSTLNTKPETSQLFWWKHVPSFICWW